MLRIVGVMTGSSLDGLDAALIRWNPEHPERRPELLGTFGRGLGASGGTLISLARGEGVDAEAIARARVDFAMAHADAVRSLCGDSAPDLVAMAGQTVHHAPPFSWQFAPPSLIAAELGCPVVADLRAADIAAGGNGAPITPLGDAALFSSESESVAVVNLGGFINVTLLPAGCGPLRPAAIRGFDVCACNHLLNGLARRAVEEEYDHDGQLALTGRIDEALLAHLQILLDAQASAARSLGSGDELHEAMDLLADHASAADLLRTACRAIAKVTASRVPEEIDRVYIAGGSAHNAALMHELRHAISCTVETTESAGIPVGSREAAIIALLGAWSAAGWSITLPEVTGRRPGVCRSGLWAFPYAEDRVVVPAFETACIGGGAPRCSASDTDA